LATKCVEYIAAIAAFLLVRRKILRLYWGGCAIKCDEYMPVDAALFARETQDFASLLAGAIIILK